MREEIIYTGESGKLYGRLWIGDHPPRGVVIVVHGLGDHSGSYQSFARYLLTHRWAVFAYDQQGHGLSPGARGSVNSYRGLLSDIACVRDSVSSRLPDLAHTLLGHSMGGNLALNYLVRYRELSADQNADGIATAILASPVLLPPGPPSRPAILAAWITGMAIPWYRVRIAERDETANSDDPLVHRRISIRLATSLLAHGRWALDAIRDLDLPVTLVVGQEDRMIDRAACEHCSVRSAKIRRVDLPGHRHNIGATEEIAKLIVESDAAGTHL